MSGAGKAAPAGRARVLVIDDDPTILQMIAAMLRPFYDVTIASDGKQAYDLLERGSAADLIITDLMMPGMDGITLAKTLKKNAKLAKIPIIMLTAKHDAGSMINGINSGARHYISKPFKQDDLLAKIKKTIGR
jgi:DNA-binding response OmpR family regulator